eukprot:COSAG06_NODE_3473_length_5293_cov_1.697728_3_plen_169_part_00
MARKSSRADGRGRCMDIFPGAPRVSCDPPEPGEANRETIARDGAAHRRYACGRHCGRGAAGLVVGAASARVVHSDSEGPRRLCDGRSRGERKEHGQGGQQRMADLLSWHFLLDILEGVGMFLLIICARLCLRACLGCMGLRFSRDEPLRPELLAFFSELAMIRHSMCV